MPEAKPLKERIDRTLADGVEGQETALRRELQRELDILQDYGNALPPGLEQRLVELEEYSRKFRPWMARFIGALRITGIESVAAAEAGISLDAAMRHQKENPQFSVAWSEAKRFNADLVEARARQLAVEGVDMPIFQKGVQVGSKRVYSERMLENLLKADKPERFSREKRMRLELARGEQERTPAELTDKVRNVLPTLRQISGRVIDDSGSGD